mgnify:CR=1 FL=1
MQIVDDTPVLKEYNFRVCFIDPVQGRIAASFIADYLGYDKAAILYDVNDDYAQGLKDNFIAVYTEKGGTVVAEEGYTAGDTDFTAQLTKIKEAQPQIIFTPIFYQDFIMIHGIEEADAEVVFLELTVLHGDLLVGRHGGHIGDLVLVENGLDGDALTRGVRADDRADLILRAQALGNVDRLLCVALGVVADQLDLLAKQAAVGVEIVNEHLNRLALAGTESSLVAGQRAHPAELDDIVAVAASFVLRPAADEQCREHQTGQGESNELLHRFAHGLILLQIVVTNSLPEWSGLAGMDVRRAGSIPAFTPSLLMCMTRKSGK